MNCLITLRRAPGFFCFLWYVVSLQRRRHICAKQEYEEKLTALLEGEEKTMLLRLLNAENEIGSTLALENFILGFRLGMRVAIEALDEDDGSLTALPEGW